MAPSEALHKFDGLLLFTHNRQDSDLSQKLPDAIRRVESIKKNFMAPFYGRGATTSRLEPLRGGSLRFTTKFPETPDTQFIDLGRMKG